MHVPCMDEATGDAHANFIHICLTKLLVLNSGATLRPERLIHQLPKHGCVCIQRLFHPDGSLVFSSIVRSHRRTNKHTPHPSPPCECKQYSDIIKSQFKPIIHLHRLTVYRLAEQPFTTSNQYFATKEKLFSFVLTRLLASALDLPSS